MNTTTSGSLAYKLERPEQIINGKVVMMASASVPHGFVAENINNIFYNYLRGKRCTPFGDGTDLYLEDDKERYIPDGMIVCDPEKIKFNGVHGAPDLVVEILSPSTSRYDMGHKMKVYEKHGVRECWIVNPVTRSLNQYLLKDGQFVLWNVYMLYTEEMLKDMKEEERAAIVTEFQCSLFDDLTIRLEDVFYRVPAVRW